MAAKPWRFTERRFVGSTAVIFGSSCTTDVGRSFSFFSLAGPTHHPSINFDLFRSIT